MISWRCFCFCDVIIFSGTIASVLLCVCVLQKASFWLSDCGNLTKVPSYNALKAECRIVCQELNIATAGNNV